MIVLKAADFMVCRPKARVTVDPLQALRRDLEQNAAYVSPFVLLDLSQVRHATTEVAAELNELGRLLAGRGKELVFLDVSADARNFLEYHKLSRAFESSRDIFEFFKMRHIAVAPKFRLDLQEAFQDSAFAFLEKNKVAGGRAGAHYFTDRAPKPVKGVVSASLPLEGKRTQGFLNVHLQPRLFAGLVSAMLGEKVVEGKHLEYADFACEVVSALYSQSRGALNERGYEFQSQLPCLVGGEDKPFAPGGRMRTLIPISSQSGFLLLELVLS